MKPELTRRAMRAGTKTVVCGPPSLVSGQAAPEATAARRNLSLFLGLGLYLGWQRDRVQGTDGTHKIGRRGPNGCVGPENAPVEGPYALSRVGPQETSI